MKKLAGFLVDKRNVVLAVFFILAVASGILMQKVNVNHDMTKYLPENSSMKKGMDIMEEQFGVEDSSLLKVMFRGLNQEQKESIYNELSDIKHVDSVDYEPEDEKYNKDGNTLYVLNTKYDSYSDESAEVYHEVSDKYFDNYEVYTSGDILTANVPSLPLWIIGLALLILMIVLFAMCESWLEPILFLITIAIAIVINMGTNVFLPSISDTTHSIVAILQLILSMDYSIILLNRYRQEKQNNPEKSGAMKSALKNSFAAITSSSVTTFVGLLALVFMSFKIGTDMGVALSKGVMFSLICNFAVLPALLLLFDRPVDKLRKKALHFNMKKIGAFEYKFRHVISGLFIMLFIAVFFWKGTTETAFTLEASNEVDKVFTPDNTIVMLYENSDEAEIEDIANQLENNSSVKSVSGYVNTLGKEYTSEELAEELKNMVTDVEFDESMISIIYYDYYKKGETVEIPLDKLMKFIQEDVYKNESFAKKFDEDITEQIEMLTIFTDKEEIEKERSSVELAGLFGIDSAMIDQLFAMSGKSTMNIQSFLNFITQNVLTNPSMQEAFDENQQSQLKMITEIVNSAAEGKSYSASEFVEQFGTYFGDMDQSTVELLYLYYSAINYSDKEWKLSIAELFNYLTTDVMNDVRFAGYFDDSIRQELQDMSVNLDEGVRQLKGNKYSRLIITVSLSEDSEETRAFIEELNSQCDKLEGDYYLVGNSPMAFEMSQTFDGEMNKITLITAFAIFVTVVVTFRSFVVPLVLVLLIQCGVYATMGVIGLQGYSIYYLALLIVQSILMGAMIDYAILYTSYYREMRKKLGIKEAVNAAYNGSIQTIMTSALIVILVTGILGYTFADPTTNQIVRTISIGALCATFLIIFILPGILASMDKFIVKTENSKTQKKDAE